MTCVQQAKIADYKNQGGRAKAHAIRAMLDSGPQQPNSGVPTG
jgi:hypothetical protein